MRIKVRLPLLDGKPIYRVDVTSDDRLLCAARHHGLTRVTYHLKTIPRLVAELAADGISHAGNVFVDDASMRGSDISGPV